MHPCMNYLTVVCMTFEMKLANQIVVTLWYKHSSWYSVMPKLIVSILGTILSSNSVCRVFFYNDLSSCGWWPSICIILFHFNCTWSSSICHRVVWFIWISMAYCVTWNDLKMIQNDIYLSYYKMWPLQWLWVQSWLPVGAQWLQIQHQRQYQQQHLQQWMYTMWPWTGRVDIWISYSEANLHSGAFGELFLVANLE